MKDFLQSSRAQDQFEKNGGIFLENPIHILGCIVSVRVYGWMSSFYIPRSILEIKLLLLDHFRVNLI
jgi:hypothetical protein